MDKSRTTLRKDVEQNLRQLEPLLTRSQSDQRPIGLMLCGVAGAGKSTYAKAVTQLYPDFQRVSIDGITGDRHGIYGIDYPASEYEKHQDESDVIFRDTVDELFQAGERNVVLDRAFYAKEDRDFYRDLITRSGGRYVLLHLQAPKDILWQRVCNRRKASVNADCALDIDRALLDGWFDGFEIPVGEGEIVIDTCKEST